MVPIYKKDDERTSVLEACDRLKNALTDQDVRVHVDDRDQFRPGWKFAEWELKGVPVRIEIGPRDLASGEVRVGFRFSGDKRQEKLDSVASQINGWLDEAQKGLFQRALDFRAANTTEVNSYDEFKEKLAEPGGYLSAHWDGTTETEEKIQRETKASIRCIPLTEDNEGGDCVYSGAPSKRRVLFAKAY